MRGYQRRALAWMVSREACAAVPDQEGCSARPSSSKSAVDSPTVWNGTPHPSWQRVALPSGLPLFHNWMTGMSWKSTGINLLLLQCVASPMARAHCMQQDSQHWTAALWSSLLNACEG